MTDIGTTLVARYALTAPLPHDLTNVAVWAAEDQVLGRQVRIVLPSGPHVAATLDAARRAALVSDPRLLRVLDVGVDRMADALGGPGTDVPYVVTERVQGSTLGELVAAGPLSPGVARTIVGEAAAALESARRRGLHHWALRPDAVRVVGSRVVVTGLGVDGPVSGLEDPDGDVGSRRDADALVGLLYHLQSGRWPGNALEGDWLSPDAPRPSPAPRSRDGAPVGLDQLAPQAPGDLVTLCAATFTTGTGPHTPGEVVAALEPWAALPPEGPVPTASAAAASLASTSPAAVAAPSGGAPARESVLHPGAVVAGGVAAGAAAGVAAGGAVPVLRDPSGVGGATLAGPTTPAPPVVAAPTSAQPGPAPQRASWATPSGAGPQAPSAGGPQDPAGGGPNGPAGGWPGDPSFQPEPPRFSRDRLPKSADEVERHRFDPTRVVLALFTAGVVVATVFAVVGLTHNFKPALVYQEKASPAAAAPQATSKPGATQQPTQAPQEDVRPIIAKGQQVDPPPQGDQNEHPEAADRAYDGDLKTYWYTRTYNTQEFSGLKSGVGYEITLEQAAPVSRIVLDTNNNGGHVEVRATDAANPTDGTVLASASFSPETTLSFDKPVTAKRFVLWITVLPKTSEGKNRVELNEIQIS
ncbi:hypothetical protein ACFT5B_00620 [Luteimicrobium sp. NPDC057192]|uniref:hypothetical protein n=1 Tax=Luteimicrobium sp. NPDC057192 TaxID=3346042 RepID=UPI00363EE5D5